MKKVHARCSDANWYDTHYYNKPAKKRIQWYDTLLFDTAATVGKNDRILEVGCGESYALKELAQRGLIQEENMYGIDQSELAISHIKEALPHGNFCVGDIYSLPYNNDFFDYVFMMEVIEHLEKPTVVLEKISKIIKKGGLFYLSFPNFSVFPWKIVRKFSDAASIPQLINKQPIDMIYTIAEVKSMVERMGFTCVSKTGVTYLTAALTVIESFDNYRITKTLNRLGLWKWSLHPLLKFVKK